MNTRIMAVLLIAATAMPAWAAPWEGHRGAQSEQRGQQRESQGGSWQGQPRERRMEDDRRSDRRRDGALSEEERRGLHRDLDRANRELYRRR